MTDTIRATASGIAELGGGLKELTAYLEANAKQYASIKSAQDKARKAASDYYDISYKQNNIFKKNYVEIIKKSHALKVAIKAAKEIRKEEEAINALMQGQSVVLNKVKSAWGTANTAAKGFISSAATLGAVVGVGSFSFKSIYEAALDYNDSMVSLGKTERSVGGGTSDLSGYISNLSNEIGISETAIAKMAKSIQVGFVGIPPSTQAIGEMSKKIRSLVVTSKESEEATKNLYAVEAKSTDAYKLMSKNIEIAAAARASGNNTSADEKAQMEANIDTMRRYQQEWGLSNEQINEHGVILADMTKDDLKNQASQKAHDDVLKSYNNSLKNLGNAAMPVFTELAKAATKFLEYVSANSGKVTALFGGLAALQALKPFAGLIRGAAELGGGGAAGLLKFAGSVGAVVGAFGVGWAAGTWIDDMTGISDSVSKWWGEKTDKKNKMQNVKDTQEYLEKLQAQFDGVDVWDMFEKAGGDVNDIKGFSIAAKVEWDLKRGGSMEGAKDEAKNLQAELEKMVKGGTGQSEEAEKLRKKIADVGRIVGDTTKKQDEQTAAVQQTERGHKKLVDDTKVRLEGLSKVTAYMESQISLAEQMGMVDKAALQGRITGLKAEQSDQEAVIADRLDLLSQDATLDLKFNVDDTAVEKISSAIESLSARQSELMNSGQKKSAEYIKNNETLKKLAEDTIAYKQKENEIINANYDISMATMKQMETMTSKAEARLNAEKSLMESAQFGMGASVEMMQKQVALAQEMMQTYAKTNKEIGQTAIVEGKITSEQLQQLGNITSADKAQQYITETLKKQGPEAKALTKYWGEHQDITTNELKQQQKIYDITKDVREGYLDAMTEMAAGAGEFSKIIGTQDKGVTQLMQSVKDVTGEDRMNTMALGGKRVKDAGGGRTKVAGTFGTTGYKSGRSKAEQEADNTNIHGYKPQYNDGTTVGTASVGTREVRAGFEAGDNGTKDNRSVTGETSVNPGVPKGAFKNDARSAHPGELTDLSAREANKASGQAAASGVPTISPGQPYAGGSGNNVIRIEVTLKPTGDLSKYVEATTEIIESVIA